MRVVQEACGVAVLAFVLGFLLVGIFSDRAYCWSTPDAEPNRFTGFRECWQVEGSMFDGVMSYLGVTLILAAPVIVVGALVWLFRSSTRGR
ncbi:hypothetical protein [Streptomyces sp. NPDC046805]|uniref:hypothetical protein n=1 Tax=Streptomyces sp. NPDC046805 TaxID=3155134 RepID=UPI0033D3A268